MSYSNKTIRRILKSPSFVQTVIDTILSKYQSNDIVSRPRIELSGNNKNDLMFNEDNFEKNSIEAIEYRNYKKYYYNNFYYRNTFLTGSSVAATILNLLYKTNLLYNDIDLFYYEWENCSTDFDVYRKQYDNLKSEHYDLLSSKEDGVLNFIRIMPGDKFTWHSLIDSFDLNYAQVGIDLGSKEIFYTKDFLKFLKTRVIEPTEYYLNEDYIWTTLIRAKIKQKEWGVKFFIEKHVLEHYKFNLDTFLINDKVINEVFHTSDEAYKNQEEFITEKRWNQWLINPELLEPYFSIVNNKSFKVNLKDSPFFSFYKKVLSSTDFIGKLPFLTSIQKIDKMYIQNKCFFDKFYKILFLTEDIRCWLPSTRNEKETLFNFLKEDFSFKNIEKIYSFFKEHQVKFSVIELLIEHNYSSKDVISFFHFIRKKDSEFIGQLESNNYGSMSTIRSKKINEIISLKKWTDLDELFETFKLEDLKTNTLVEKPLNIKLFKKWVKEITTLSDLKKEGQIMHHCVGGYSNQVKNGFSRIFHIEINNEKSTLEMSLTNSVGPDFFNIVSGKNNILNFKIVQHKGISNKTPSSRSQDIANRLVKYLNNYT